MHVVINAFSARRGGGQTYLINLLSHLSQEIDMRVTVLLSAHSSFMVDHPSVRIRRIRFPVDNPFLRVWWEQFHLPRLLRRENADVLFCPGGIISTKVPSGCKTVTMFRNMIPFDQEQRKKYKFGYMRFRCWILNKVMLRSMEKADLVIFISEFAKKVISRISQRVMKRNVVIPHGVGDSFLKCTTGVRPEILPSGPYIVYASTIDVYKSQVEVVRAYGLLQRRSVSTPPLLLVGAAESYYLSKVKTEIVVQKLEEKVLLTGQIPYEQMPSIYQNALMILFASQSENCPNILLESMASRKAVLTSNFPPMPEFGGEAVAYFDPRNPVDLADQLEALLKNPKLMQQLGDCAYKRALSYDWENAVLRTWEAIASVSN